MIAELALTLAKYFSAKEVYGKDKVVVYKYGFELLLSTIINLLGIFLISVVMGSVVDGILFCTAFIPLRLAAGGYHAKHHWSCIGIFNITFLAFAVLNRYLPAKYALIYALIAIMISSILIWVLAPVEAVNKPLKEAQREIQRQRSIVLACVNITLVLLFFGLERIRPFTPLFAYYCSGALAASLSLLIAEIVNRHNGIAVEGSCSKI